MPRVWLTTILGLLSLIAGLGLGQEHTPALAHAVLLRSVPPTGQTLSRAPDEVRLLFSEPIDAVFSGIHVTNASGDPVDRGDARVDPADDHQLVVSLQQALPDGVYTVSWRSLSTIDVHPDEGRYPLFVGVPPSTSAALRPQSIPTPAATPPTTLGRWWFYLAASLFGGTLLVWKLVIGPVLADEYTDARQELHRRAYRLCVIGGVLLVAGTLFTAVGQAAAAAGVPLLAGFGQPLSDLLLRGRFAAIWWPRIGLELASLLLIAFGGLEGLAGDCALATLPAVLLTSSLTSHGAALAGMPGLGIVTDWLHILGAAAWVGGLMGLVLCLPALWAKHTLVPRLIARFSRFALFASLLVTLSGVVQAVFEVGSWSALATSSYGQLVLLKIAFLGGMLLLATFNTRRASVDSSTTRLQLLRRGVWAELAVGVVILAVASVLTGTPPVTGAR